MYNSAMKLTMKSVSRVLMGVLLAAGAQVMGATAVPMVIAHRGESKDRPENTMAAFRLSVERGVDAIECDVYTTTDGVPVIIHDSTTGRTAGEGTNLTVTASSWDDLKDVKVTAFGDWATSAYADETIPKFADYLALLEGSSVKAVVELKGAANSCVARVVEAVQAQPAATADRVVFISFTADIIRAVRQALPDYPAYLLLSSAENADEILSKLAACNATGVDILYTATAVNATDIAAIKAAGYTFVTWTVDNINTVVAEAQMGVDGITTNKGGEFKDNLPAALAEAERWAPIADPSRPLGLLTYDVGDYVQDGLVAHYDGIRNAGADAAHDAAATTWKNLVAGAPDAAFEKKAGDTGSWLANGYAFAGASFARMAEPGVALGDQLTIQVASAIDYRRQPTNTWPNVIATPNDFCIYYNNRTATAPQQSIVWKTEPYAGENWGTRPNANWTTGDYITAILDADKQWLFWGTDRSAGSIKDRTVFQSLPAMRWTWGGSSWSGGQDRYLQGTIHSVRLYNRVLTDAEIIQNRKVDDYRFRSVYANVTVQTSLPGAEGVEPSGDYAVNGLYTFTTPASVTVGEATYAPAGYQLEVWNALSNVWEFVSASTATSFAYTNCVARPKARVTWLWKMTDGQVRLDADAYAPFGLVGNWDGLRNAGLNAAHDDAASVWKNLSGGVDATHYPITQDGAWERDGYRFVGGDAWRMDGTVDLGPNFTVQIAADVIARDQHTNNFNGAGTAFPSLFGTTEDVGNIYAATTSETLNFKCDAVMGGDWTTGTRASAWWPGSYISAFVAFDRSGLSRDAALPTFKSAYSYKGAIGPRRYCLGGVPMGGTPEAKALRCLIGTIHSARLYTRVLTPVELAWNRFVDDVRFRGLHTVAATGLVAVAGSDAEGYGATDGVYLMRSGSRTFAVPASIEHAGRRYVCTGYRVEAVDPTLKAFTTVETRSGATSCTLTADVTKNRRIVWQWQVNRLRTAADYDVGDYVQEGLVANFDGIRNVSAVLPHDPTATTWRDVSEQKNRAPFYGKNVGAGHWADGNAYSFNETSYAQTTNALVLGKTLTIEQVLDIDLDGQTQSYPNYVAMWGDRGVFTRSNNRRRLEWKHDDFCGTPRPMQSNWQGRYLTALATADTSYLFQGTSYANGVERTKFADFGASFWEIAAAAGNNAESRYSKGLYHATRFYNRALTEAELAWNRKVDEVRFRGAVITNVVVASSNAEAGGVESNGVYEVEGSWTFTAQPVELASGKTLRPAGYTLETWNNGTWGARESYSGTNYTYTAATATAPVRLTWRYATGTLLIFR